ncbi:MAG: light-regulated signal transduction histidine kinase (bacteriophytochrome), partial [Limisphaerales bacterium]
QYSGIAFNSSDLIQYRYRLNGQNNDWVTTGTDEIRYSSLLPGKYKFEVVAVDKDGLQSSDPASFEFIISKPAYQTWWFVCLVLLSVAGMIYVTYRVMLGHYERKSLKRSVSAKTIELDHKIRELRRSNDELEQFAYIASHDLKEPLRNIANYIQLIKRKYNNKLDENGLEYMGFAVDGVKRMYEMIDGLLSYSGLVNQDTSVTTVNLNDVVDEVIFNVVHDEGEQKIVINKNNLPVVSAHPKQIRELLNNLIDNSIKFNTSIPPVIGIEGLERDEEYEIRIMDNGIGLDEQFKDKVFQIFEQLDNSFSKPGSGIGLALCKKIVERHGGRIWYTSGDKGSTFHFTLKKHIENQTA